MEPKVYRNVLENLKLNGEAEIDKIISSGDQENFFLDFKNLSTAANATSLSEDDRKNLAKAISGFSNTSGGLIVWGIKDNRDSTFSKMPFENPDKVVGMLNDSVSKLSLPIMSKVNSFAIKNKENSGYIITEIPKYYFSPVQVNPALKIKDVPGKYYIRSGSDFVVANHDIISSLYNRQSQSKLIYFWADNGVNTYSEDENTIKCRLNLVLQNKGTGILRNIWINYTAGGMNSVLEKTQQIGLFTGWDIFGLVINLITIDGYKLGPQQSLNPFSINITISKTNITKGAYIYFSFGAEGAVANEIEIKFEQEKMNEYLSLPQEQRNLKSFMDSFNLNEK